MQSYNKWMTPRPFIEICGALSTPTSIIERNRSVRYTKIMSYRLYLENKVSRIPLDAFLPVFRPSCNPITLSFNRLTFPTKCHSSYIIYEVVQVNIKPHGCSKHA